jgi:hypothetical protein
MKKWYFAVSLFCMIFVSASYAAPSSIANLFPKAATCTVTSTSGSCAGLEQLVHNSCMSNTHDESKCQMCSASPEGIALQIYNYPPTGGVNLHAAIQGYCAHYAGSNAGQCYSIFRQLLDNCIKFN